MKSVDPTWLLGYLPVDPVTGIAPGFDVATADGIHPMVWLTGWRYIVGRISGEHQGVTYDPSEWVIIRSGHYTGPPIVDGYLVTGPAVFGDDSPAPPGEAYAPGRDGIGPVLDGENGPTRWLLLDGYGYHISDADTGRFHVRELRPEGHATDSSPFDWRRVLATYHVKARAAAPDEGGDRHGHHRVR